MPPRLNPGDVLKDLQQRAEFVMNADKHMAEVVALLKDTHTVLATLAGVVERLNVMIAEIEKRAGGVGQVLDRLDRLEKAALNIERGTLGVEAALSALPKALRSRIANVRKPGASDPGDDAR